LAVHDLNTNVEEPFGGDSLSEAIRHLGGEVGGEDFCTELRRAESDDARAGRDVKELGPDAYVRVIEHLLGESCGDPFDGVFVVRGSRVSAVGALICW
jgi:hypothetical protein